MSTPTTNYGFDKPTDGGDDNTWGNILNGSLDKIDNQIKVNDDAAKADIDQNETDITTLEGRNDTQDTDIAALQADLAQAQTDLGALTTRVGTAETAITDLDARMTVIEQELGIT